MPQHFAVLSRRYAGALLEDSDKMTGIIKAGIDGNLRDCILRTFKNTPCLFNTVTCQILYGTLADGALHEFIEIIDRHIGGTGKPEQRKIFSVML